MWKRGKVNPTFRQRWFVLNASEGTLSYYNRQSMLKGTLSLHGSRVDELADAVLHVQQLGSHRVYVLQCDSPAESRAWLEKLRTAAALPAGRRRQTSMTCSTADSESDSDDEAARADAYTDFCSKDIDTPAQDIDVGPDVGERGQTMSLRTLPGLNLHVDSPCTPQTIAPLDPPPPTATTAGALQPVPPPVPLPDRRDEAKVPSTLAMGALVSGQEAMAMPSAPSVLPSAPSVPPPAPSVLPSAPPLPSEREPLSTTSVLNTSSAHTPGPPATHTSSATPTDAPTAVGSGAPHVLASTAGIGGAPVAAQLLGEAPVESRTGRGRLVWLPVDDEDAWSPHMAENP